MQPTSQAVSSELFPNENRARIFCFTFITDEGKKQDDEPAAEEAGAASGSAAGEERPLWRGRDFGPCTISELRIK